MAQIHYSAAEAESLLDEVAKRIHTGAAWNASGVSYTVFARIKKNTISSISSATVLVSGVQSMLNNKRGLYFMEVLNRSGADGFKLFVTTLAAPSAGTTTFGYYLDGDYYYIGVRRTGGYGGSPVSLLLNSSNNRPIEFGDYYNDSAEPAGWTAASN